MKETIYRSNLCELPSNNLLWSNLGIEPPPKNIQDHVRRGCWVGEGWGQCKMSLGMFHYPDVDTCRWWHSHVPAQVLGLIIRDYRICFIRFSSVTIHTRGGQTLSNQEVIYFILFFILIRFYLSRKESYMYR